MPRHSMPLKEARTIAQKIALEMQVELVDVELVKEPTGVFLRFYVDKPEGVSLDDLEAYHRRILPLVEQVEYDYMEVSSPGADRPFKTDADFEKAKGTIVELKTYRNIDGAKQFIGTLGDVTDEEIPLNMPDGTEKRFPRKSVAVVRPYIEFDEDDLKDG